MRYVNDAAGQLALRKAIKGWFDSATQVQLNQNWGAWIGLHSAGALLYNCGGIQSRARANGWGNDCVSQALYNWLVQTIPNSYTVTNLPHAYPSGNVMAGVPQYLQDYYNVTRVANPNYHVAANTLRAPNNTFHPAGDYQIILNFHLYVEDRYPNPYYPPPPAADSDDDDWPGGGQGAW